MAVKRRADFAENRVRILAAAEEVFLERGVAAPLDAIAQQAGVGRATFFRHFPDRRALINEMLENFLVDLEKKSASLPNAPESFLEMARYFIDRMIHYAVVADYLRAQSRDDEILSVAIQRFVGTHEPHLQAAIEAGLVRPDLESVDVAISAIMLAAANTTPNIGPEGRRRAYELVMHGLRNKV